MAGSVDELALAPAMPAAKRIVALNWEAAENLLELGITPLAVADADDYRRWVAQPCCPPVWCRQAVGWSRIWNCWPA
jgi:iron complex transport system substrate-binding protein